MLNERYKNLRVEQSFIDTLNNIEGTANPPLSEDLLRKAQEVRSLIGEETYIGSAHKDILEAYRSVAPESDRYNQVMFKKFEKEVLS